MCRLRAVRRTTRDTDVRVIAPLIRSEHGDPQGTINAPRKHHRTPRRRQILAIACALVKEAREREPQIRLRRVLHVAEPSEPLEIGAVPPSQNGKVRIDEACQRAGHLVGLTRGKRDLRHRAYRCC